MSFSIQTDTLVVVVGEILLHLLGVYLVYRKLRATVPGWWKRGTKQAPRIYVTGRLVPGPVEMRAPLSGRPCAAWRLSVVCVHPDFGHVLRTFDSYSEASFSIMCDDGPLPVELDSTWDGLFAYSFLRGIKPAWILPLADPKHERAYTVSVLGRFVTLPDHPRLSTAEADATRAVALKAVEDSNIPSREPFEGLVVTETIMDFEQVWVCEGPQLEVNGAPMMVSVDNMDRRGLEANPVKFAPQAELRAIIRRVALRELIPILLLDSFFIFMAIVVGIIIFL